jgi:hypothetical protein
LKQKHAEPLSNFAGKFNLRHYTVAACLARLTQSGGGRRARTRRIARRHREIEAELEVQAAALRAPPLTAGMAVR